MHWPVLNVGKKKRGGAYYPVWRYCQVFFVRSQMSAITIILLTLINRLVAPFFGGKGGRIAFLIEPPTNDVWDSGASPQRPQYTVLWSLTDNPYKIGCISGLTLLLSMKSFKRMEVVEAKYFESRQQ